MDVGSGWLYWIGTAAGVWAAIVGWTSVAVHARAPWWRSEVGRHLMAYMVVIALVLTLALVRAVLGDSDWFNGIRLVTFVLVPVVMTWRLSLQIRARRLARLTAPKE